MSKIALIADVVETVRRWRQQTGIDESLAAWVYIRQGIEAFGPFSSVLCLPNWEDRLENRSLRDLIVQQITAARLSEDAAGEGRLVAQINEGEWYIPENLTPAVVARTRPAEAFPSTPVLTENERVLREFGVNPALIGMLPDATLNRLAGGIRAGTGSHHDVEEVARFHRIAPWAEPISAAEIRQEALRIVQEFYGINAHFQTMNDSRLFACRDLARRGLSAAQLRGANEVTWDCRESITRIIREHAEEEISRAAGFLDPDTGSPAERTPGDGYEPPVYREAPARRAYSDPLRDHPRTYMQQERRTPRPRRRAVPYDPNDIDSF